MSELYHYGIKGQKWGNRRYQNEDGTLTEEGRKRYLRNAGFLERTQRNALIKKNYRSYTSSSKKFDKLTEKMSRRKEAGKKISKFDQRRAIKYGTEARESEKKSKAYDTWLGREARSRNRATLASAPASFYAGWQYGNVLTSYNDFEATEALIKELVGLGVAVASSKAAYKLSQISEGDYKKYKEWGESIKESSKNETIEDLKKHGLID